MSHKHGKRDGSHRFLSEYAQMRGWCVLSTADMGDGFPDVAMIRNGRWELVEFKADDGKPGTLRDLTSSELRLHAKVLRESGYRIPIVKTVGDIDALTKANDAHAVEGSRKAPTTVDGRGQPRASNTTANARPQRECPVCHETYSNNCPQCRKDKPEMSITGSVAPAVPPSDKRCCDSQSRRNDGEE